MRSTEPGEGSPGASASQASATMTCKPVFKHRRVLGKRRPTRSARKQGKFARTSRQAGYEAPFLRTVESHPPLLSTGHAKACDTHLHKFTPARMSRHALLCLGRQGRTQIQYHHLCKVIQILSEIFQVRACPSPDVEPHPLAFRRNRHGLDHRQPPVQHSEPIGIVEVRLLLVEGLQLQVPGKFN